MGPCRPRPSQLLFFSQRPVLLVDRAWREFYFDLLVSVSKGSKGSKGGRVAGAEACFNFNLLRPKPPPALPLAPLAALSAALRAGTLTAP